MYCSLKMATRVHWACILVINCNILLIIYCYLYFCLHATDYAVYLHHSESNRGTQKVSLHEAMELYECCPKLCAGTAQRCTTLEILISELQGSHVKLTGSASEGFTLWKAVESWFFCFQLSSCCFQMVKKLQAALCRCLSGTPFERSSLYAMPVKISDTKFLLNPYDS